MDFTGPIALILAVPVAYVAALFVRVLPIESRAARAWTPFLTALFVTLALSINWVALIDRRLSGDDAGLLLAMIALVAFYAAGGWLIGAVLAKLTFGLAAKLRHILKSSAE